MSIPFKDKLIQGLNNRIAPYQVVETLGLGAVGEVYVARRADGQSIAVKTVKKDVEEKGLIQRFRLEYDLLKSLDHPAIAKVFDFYYDDPPFFTMEHVTGQNLRKAFNIESQGTPADSESIRKLIPVAYQILEALSYLHQNRIIHRDMKPENVMYQEDGIVKVLDFGVARDMQRHMNLTHHQEIVGTVEYMAPEMLTGRVYDHRVDLYSLGVVLYRIVNGTRMFDFLSFVDMLKTKSQANSPVLNPEDWAEVGWFIESINKLTHRLPENRFRSAGEALEWYDCHLKPSAELVGKPAKKVVASPLLTIRSAPLFQRDGILREIKGWMGASYGLPLLIHGVSGVGKTRIGTQILSFGTELNLPTLVLDGGALAQPSGTFFGTVLKHLNAHFFADQDLEEIVPQHVDRRLTPMAFSKVLQSVGMQPPMVIVDDLHLLPQQYLQEILEFFLMEKEDRAQAGVRWVFAFNDDWTENLNVGGGGNLREILPISQELSLAPLNRDAVRDLCIYLLDGWQVDDELIGEVFQGSAGLPHAVANILGLFLRKEALVFEDERWKLFLEKERAADAVRFQGVVDDLFQRQFDRLTPNARNLLELLAVIGPKISLEFIYQGVHLDRSETDRALNELIIAELVMFHVDMVEFCHPKVQKQLYDHLGMEQRARYHRHVLLVMEGLAKKSDARYLFELIRHAEMAEDGDRVFRYNKELGIFFFSQGMFHEAQRYLGNAISIFSGAPRMILFEAYFWKAEAEMCQYRIEEAKSDFNAALELLNRISFPKVADEEKHRMMFQRIIFHKLVLANLRIKRLGDAYSQLEQIKKIHETLDAGYLGSSTWVHTVSLVERNWSTVLYPVNIMDLETLQYFKFLFETLVEQDDRGVFVGRLAKSWKWDPEPRTLTFQLRKGASYHNGALLRPEDVLFSVRMAQEQPLYNPLSSHVSRRIEAMTVDAYRNVVATYHPGAAPNMAFWANLLILPAYVYGHQVDIPRIPEAKILLGSGPYRLDRVDPDQRSLLAQDGKKTRIRRLVINHGDQRCLHGLKNSRHQWVNLTEREWQKLYPEIQFRFGLVRDQYVSNQVYRLCFKTQGPVAVPLAIRRAIYDCLPLEQWNAIYLKQDFVVPRGRILLESSAGGSFPVVRKTAYDMLQKALEQADWKRNEEGFWCLHGDPLVIRIVFPRFSPLDKIFKAMVVQWQHMGIQVKGAWDDIRIFNKYIAHPKVNAWVDCFFPEPDYEGIGDYLDSRSIAHGANLTQFADEEMDALLRQLEATPSTMREKVKVKIDALFQKKLPWLPLYQPKIYFGFDACLGGVFPTSKGVFQNQLQCEGLFRL